MPIDEVSQILGELVSSVHALSNTAESLRDAIDILRKDYDDGRSRLHTRISEHERENLVTLDKLTKAIGDIVLDIKLLTTNVQALRDEQSGHGQAQVNFETRLSTHELNASLRDVESNRDKRWVAALLVLISLAEVGHLSGDQLFKWIANLIK